MERIKKTRADVAIDSRSLITAALLVIALQVAPLPAAAEDKPAQAGFAQRVAGYENARILQGGLAEWKAKGGLDAADKATAPAKH